MTTRGGVTARFNKNVLARINRELGGGFDLGRFDHVALWNAAESRIEMHLESRRAQRVRIRALELEVAFERNERLHTENSYKFTGPMLAQVFTAANLSLGADVDRSPGWFALHLLRVWPLTPGSLMPDRRWAAGGAVFEERQDLLGGQGSPALSLCS